MLGRQGGRQKTLFVYGDIERFVPKDHILYRVNRVLDLSWLEGAVSHLYCEENGRPSIAPEAALRLMLAGFFLGIVHDRKLMREAQVNLAIRWFAGFGLEDGLPDHSSLTRIRRRWGEKTFLALFDKTVAQCIKRGLVSAKTVHVDATLIRADVKWRDVAGAWARRAMAENPDPTGPRTIIRTDPDAGLGRNCLEPMPRPSYKQHQVADEKQGVIVDVAVTAGNVNENTQFQEAVQRAKERIGDVGAVTADKGYDGGKNLKALESMGIDPLIKPQRIQRKGRGGLARERFKFDAKNCRCKCPGGKWMTLVSVNGRGRHFKSRRTDCAKCRLVSQCLGTNRQRYKTIKFGHGYAALLRSRRRYFGAGWSDDDNRRYTRHRHRVEGLHGEAKECHGLRRAVRRGLWTVAIQVYLTAAVINLKRLAKAALDAFWPRIGRRIVLFLHIRPRHLTCSRFSAAIRFALRKRHNRPVLLAWR